ncbi:MAG: metallophosphoesterase [Betaproteobacteria bacterium]
MLRGFILALRVLRDWRLWGLGAAAVLALALHDAASAWSPDGGHHRAVVKLAIYWGLWLGWPLALLLFLRMAGQLGRGRVVGAVLTLALLMLTGGVLWARFVEPNQLRVIETSPGTACGVRVAVVSDLHVGLYVREDQIERLVRRLNALDVDAVLIAGDFTFEPDRDLRAAFAPLGLISHPVYAVLGNHDEQLPGAPLKEPLVRELQSLGVHLIEGRRVPLGRCELAGLGDLEAGAAARDLARLKATHWSRPPAQRVLLTHEPDTVFDVAPGSAALMLAGHTHGGQVVLPWLTDLLLYHISRGGWQRGLYRSEAMPLFVTSGTGMARLPLRFRMPPTIDVLAL